VLQRHQVVAATEYRPVHGVADRGGNQLRAQAVAGILHVTAEAGEIELAAAAVKRLFAGFIGSNRFGGLTLMFISMPSKGCACRR
jgi:hypothetical protein